MKVDVHNRIQAESLRPNPNTAVISISHPGRLAELKEGWLDVLRLEFDDAISPTELAPELVLFNNTHVERIHGFVRLYDDYDFMVHCDAGMSRSTAVAVFLREIYDAEVKLHAAYDFSMANSRVVRGLMRGSWEKRLKS